MKLEDRENLKKLVLKQIIEDFRIIKEKSEGEKLYAFGVGLVEDITGFFSAGNSIESAKKQSEEYEYFDRSNLWHISEWEYDGSNDNAVHEFLHVIIKNIDWEDKEYENTKKEYEQILFEVLKECKDKGIFEEQTIVYVHYADASNEEIDDISSEIINSTELHNSFKYRWTENKDNNLTKIILDKIKTIK